MVIRISCMFLILFIASVIVGCSNGEIENPQTLSHISDYGELPSRVTDKQIDLEMYMEKIDLPVEKIQLQIINRGTDTIHFGTSYRVEKFEKDQWYEIPFIENSAFNSIGLLLEPNHTYEQIIHVRLLDYQLVQGKYRIIKRFNGDETEITLAAPFEIVE